MTQASNIILLSQAIGLDIATLRNATGTLANLTTTDKSNIVAALNELKTSIAGAGGGAVINDAAASGTTTYSSTKINTAISAAITAVVDGAPTAFDTLKELADYVASDQTAASAMTTAINNRVRFDAAQTLTTGEQLQACNNIGVGNPETDYVAAYNTAKA